jgi:hypothetical protein
VSNSDENFNATLLKVEGGNVEFGGGLSVTGNTTLSRLEMRQEKFDTILIRRTDALSTSRVLLRNLQVYVDNSDILPSATNATQSIRSGSLGGVIEFMTWNNLSIHSSGTDVRYASNIVIGGLSSPVVSSDNIPYISLYIPLTQSYNISDIQSFVLYNFDNVNTTNNAKTNGFQIELYNRSNGFSPGSNILYTMPINTTAPDYRFDLPAITTYTGNFSSGDSQTQIKDITVSASSQNLETTSFKVEDGNTEIGGNLSVGGLFGSSNIFQILVKNASNPIYSYTVPVKGIYMISISVNIQNVDDFIFFDINNILFHQIHRFAAVTGNSDYFQHTPTILREMNVNDVLTIRDQGGVHLTGTYEYSTIYLLSTT